MEDKVKIKIELYEEFPEICNGCKYVVDGYDYGYKELYCIFTDKIITDEVWNDRKDGNCPIIKL